MTLLARGEARDILRDCGISERGDFHKLDSDAVAKIVAAADLHGYRAPTNANGSRARYYHAYLTRRAFPDIGKDG